MHNRTILAMLTLSFSAVACGSGGGGSPGMTGAGAAANGGGNGTSSSGATGGATPADGGSMAAAPGIPAGHADPCADMPNTKYLNDDLCLEPPDPDVGLQLHFGPTDYDNPDEVNKYVIPAGGEDVVCQFFTTPNTEDRHFIEYHARLRSGTHHMITYMTDEKDPVAPDGTLGECSLSPGYRFVLGSQAALGPEGGKLDVPLPGKTATAPENEGLASILKAKTHGTVELHYVNTTSDPMLREAWINIIYADEADIKGIVDPIFFIGGLAMNVQPHTEEVVQAKGCGLDDPAREDQIRILGLTAHAHSHTKRMSAWINRMSGERELIYESYTWSEPLNAQFDSVHTDYPEPGNGTVDGAVTGLVTLQRGETIDWECDVVNNDLDIPLQFKNSAYEGEMCNLFGFVTPGLGAPWSCLKP